MATATEIRVPPLRDGDCLTIAEFERRYEAMPDVKKAELVEGIVYMGSPVSSSGHSKPHFRCITWIGVYQASTPCVEGDDNASLRLKVGINRLQPDIALRLLPEAGGQAILDNRGYIEGAPELVVEIASSSASYDLTVKRRAYEINGVREYIVWRVDDKVVDWFVLRNDSFVPLPLASDGYFKSESFPGLWLDAKALIAGNTRQVMAVLQQGLASAEHAAFVAKVEERESKSQTNKN